MTNAPLSQKEYLKRYLTGDDVKKKKKKKITASTSIKRSRIVDDDIDLKNMRPLDDDELDLFHMDEEAPQIAGIVDERPAEVKAQEYYNSKRWKVFGGEDGVNIVDNLNQNQAKDSCEPNSSVKANSTLSKNLNKPNLGKKTEKYDFSNTEVLHNHKQHHSDSDSDISLPRKSSISNHQVNLQKKYDSSDSNDSVDKKRKKSQKGSSNLLHSRKVEEEKNYDSDASPPRRKDSKDKQYSDTDTSPPKKKSNNSRKAKHSSDSDISPPRRNENKKKSYKSDSDNSPPWRRNDTHYKSKSSDKSRDVQYKRKEKFDKVNNNNTSRSSYSLKKSKRNASSDSDNSPPRRDSRKLSNTFEKNRALKLERMSMSPENRNKSQQSKSTSRLSRKDSLSKMNTKRNFSDSDDSPPRRKKKSQERSSSDQSPPRRLSLKSEKPLKKSLYKPNDSSSSDGEHRSKKNKMKTTLDGKRSGLQDAKELKKELSNFKMKEDLIFSKMDASVSGIGAAPIKRDRKTGQVRDLEKEKEAQKEKEAKASVVNEKYYKWGKGLKQVEDAAERTAEIMKEMNKPLARYVDDKDLDNFLKAQEREGDPMLDYIKQKQSEAIPLSGTKPVYQGSFNPNRFGIRPGHRWDGVVRSNGYEKEWFTHQNARKARDEEAYKWSTSDM